MGKNSPSRLRTSRLILAQCGALMLAVGCDPEMPSPPKDASKNPAEESFHWAMERLEHALEKFRSSSNLGLSVERELDYKLIPPQGEKSNYRAQVTISVLAVYRPEPPSTVRERKQAEAAKRKEADKLKLDNPFQIPGEAPTLDGVEVPEIPPADVTEFDVPDPRIPTQRIEEEKDYLLEYIGNKWELVTTDLEDHERLWFDYALEQGEFAPKSDAR